MPHSALLSCPLPTAALCAVTAAHRHCHTPPHAHTPRLPPPQEDLVPKDLLLPAMAFRFSLMDRPDRITALISAAAALATSAQQAPQSPAVLPGNGVAGPAGSGPIPVPQGGPGAVVQARPASVYTVSRPGSHSDLAQLAPPQASHASNDTAVPSSPRLMRVTMSAGHSAPSSWSSAVNGHAGTPGGHTPLPAPVSYGTSLGNANTGVLRSNGPAVHCSPALGSELALGGLQTSHGSDGSGERALVHDMDSEGGSGPGSEAPSGSGAKPRGVSSHLAQSHSLQRPRTSFNGLTGPTARMSLGPGGHTVHTPSPLHVTFSAQQLGPASGGAGTAVAAAAAGPPAGAASTGQVLAATGATLGLAGPLPLAFLPRRSYLCTLEYGLPGGSEYACVPLQDVWEDLVPQLHVRVSGTCVPHPYCHHFVHASPPKTMCCTV